MRQATFCCNQIEIYCDFGIMAIGIAKSTRMSAQELKTLLGQLEQQLADTELDEESRRLLGDLGKHIDTALEDGDAYNMSPMMETATLLETDFAAKHPTAEKLLRTVMDAMVKMGV